MDRDITILLTLLTTDSESREIASEIVLLASPTETTNLIDDALCLTAMHDTVVSDIHSILSHPEAPIRPAKLFLTMAIGTMSASN